MSGDIAAPVESAPSAPQSTQDIASSVIHEAETADTASAEPSAPPAGTPETPAVPMSAAEELLRAEGYNPKRIDGRDNLIPWSRVAKIVEKGITEGKGEFGQRYQKLTTDHDTVSKEAAELRAFRDQFATALRGDPRQFLSEIAKHDPRYAAFLQQQIEAAKPAVDEDPEPQPDYELGNGQRTYTLEGLKKREAWLVRQMEKRVEDRMKPWQEREEQAQQQAQQARQREELTGRVQTQITEAQQWPRWSESEPEVLKKLQEDSAKAAAAGRRPTMTLREAYLETQAAYLAADDTTKRTRWLEEMNKSPKSTSVAKAGVESTAKAGPKSTAEIARATIASLEAGR